MWLLLSRKIKTFWCYGGLVLLCCSCVAVVFLDVTLRYNSTVVALKLKNQNLPVWWWCGGGGGGGGFFTDYNTTLRLN